MSEPQTSARPRASSPAGTENQAAGAPSQAPEASRPNAAANPDGHADRSTFRHGSRVGVLLIHGMGGTPVEMRFLANALERVGLTVLCCQLAGHCDSVEALRRSTWTQWYASVETAHDQLLRHCDVVVAGGLSMGGILAAHLAQNRPKQVHGLAFLAPTLWLNGWSMPWHSRILRYIRPTRFNPNITLPEREPYGLKDERIRALVLRSMQDTDSSKAGVFSTPVRTFAHFNCLCDAVKPRLGEIKVPSLILHPRDDDIADLDNAFYLQRRLAGRVEMVVLEDSYHIITLDRQRHAVVERVLAFVDAIAQANAGLIAASATGLATAAE